MARLTWDPKDPDENLDYDIDWSARMVSGDTINASTWTIMDGTVVKGDNTFTVSATKVWLSGGALGETCELLNRVTTTNGRVMDQTVFIKIAKR